MWTFRSRTAAIAVAALAAACGGGGDDGGSGPQLPTLVTISAANQDTVAHASIATIMPFLSMPTLSISPSQSQATKAMASGSPANGHGGLAYLVLRSVGVGYKQLPAAPDGIARPLTRYQDTFPCLVSGSITLTMDDNDDSMSLTAGDALTVLFSQCSDWVGSTINGSMAMSIATFSATPAAADMTGSMMLQSLAMNEDGVGFVMNGGASFRINESTTLNGRYGEYAFTVAGGGLTVVDSGSAIGFADTYSYRPGFTTTERDFTSNVQGIPSTEELTARGDFGSMVLGGDLSLTTEQPIRSAWTNDEGDIFPLEGQLVANGNNGTRLSLSATATSQARMDMCDDGDGIWEATRMVDWIWLTQ